jgi:hypothetical protein
MNSDKATTLAGLTAGGLTAATVDFGKVLNGDQGEIIKLLIAVALAALGHFTNKPVK